MQLNRRVAFVVFLGLFGVAACGGGGGGGGVGSTPPPPPPTVVSGFAYVANSASNDVSAYSINAATGALTQIPCGSGAGCNINNNNFRAGTNPVSVTVDPSAKFVYVANQIDNDVSAYRINAVTGALTQILCGGVPGCVGDNFQAVGASGASSVVVDPALGKFAYMANEFSSDVSAFTIDTVTGALTQIPCGIGPACVGDNFRAGTRPLSVTVDPSGKYVYVANSGSNDVSAYSVTPVTGALVQIPCRGGPPCIGDNFRAAGASGASSITVDPFSDKFVYMANAFSNDVSAFTINVLTGALVQILCGGGTGCIGNNFLAGNRPLAVTVDPSAKFAYVANRASNDVSAYSVNVVTGALTQIPCGNGTACVGANFLAGTRPLSVTVDTSGKFAYVVNSGSNDISAYRVDAVTGALTQISCGGGAGCNGNNFQTGNSPLSITTTEKI